MWKGGTTNGSVANGRKARERERLGSKVPVNENNVRSKKVRSSVTGECLWGAKELRVSRSHDFAFGHEDMIRVHTVQESKEMERDSLM